MHVLLVSWFIYTSMKIVSLFCWIIRWTTTLTCTCMHGFWLSCVWGMKRKMTGSDHDGSKQYLDPNSIGHQQVMLGIIWYASSAKMMILAFHYFHSSLEWNHSTPCIMFILVLMWGKIIVLVVCCFLNYYDTDFGLTHKEGSGWRRIGWKVVEEAGSWWKAINQSCWAGMDG